MKDLETLLKEIGLEHQESKVYISALQLGTSPASVIGKQLQIPRSTARYTCEQLIKKQLMLPSQKGNTVYFTAENPEKLKKLLDLQREEIDLMEVSLSKNMSDLIGLYNPDTVLPKIVFYEGIEGVREALDKIIDEMNEGGEIQYYGSIRAMAEDENDKKVIKLLDRFVQQRIENKITVRLITTYTKGSEGLKTRSKDELRETRFAKSYAFNFPAAEVIFFNDKIYAMTKENNMFFAYIVQSANITKIHRGIFEMAWKQAGIDDKEICKTAEYKRLSNKAKNKK